MKIIGESRESFIIECDKDEAYNLIGFYSRYSDKPKKLEVGDEIRVHDMYQKLNNLAYFQRDFQNVSKQLRAFADILEEIDPLVKGKLNEEIQ